MSFRWREYVNLAKVLCESNQDSFLRSSVSRAYYGAFCLCRNYLKLSNIKTGQVHRIVSDKLNSSDDDDIFLAGQYIDELFKARKNCDYEGEHIINQKDAQKLIQKAIKVVEIIDDLESSHLS